MKKTINIILVVIIVLLGVLIYITFKGYEGLNDIEIHATKMKTFISKKIILDKDTLVILDYNTFGDEFVLSDGKKVSAKTFSKFIIKD